MVLQTRFSVVAITLICVICSVRATGVASELLGISRVLQADEELVRQESVSVSIQVADFSKTPRCASDLSATRLDGYIIPERLLDTSLELSTLPESALKGTYSLSRSQALKLNLAVSQEMPVIPPEEASVTLMDNGNFFFVSGLSFEGSESMEQARRIPTVWDPSRAGHIFEWPERSFILMVTNITLLAENATYGRMAESGLFDYLRLPPALQSAEEELLHHDVCFTNSIFIVKSCDGHINHPSHALCCTRAICVEYTLDDLRERGFGTPGESDPITCYALRESGATTRGGGGRMVRRVFLIVGAAASMLVVLLLLALASFLALRWLQRKDLLTSSHRYHLRDNAASSSCTRSVRNCCTNDTGQSLVRALHTQSSHAEGLAPTCSHLEHRGPASILEASLDLMRARKLCFMGQFEILGPADRRVGGQGVVQFALRTGSTSQCALKFFMDTAAYRREVSLYNDPSLRMVMPSIHAATANTNAQLTAPNNYIFPPVIVIERGESLDEFAARVENESITIIQALVLVVKRVQQLHAAGLVHRDLKPGNILRMPHTHSWVLIDFGCAAATGSRAPLAYSPAYAAPELVAAVEDRQEHVLATEATDIWAVGIVAYELLTDKVVFPTGVAKGEIHAAIMGREPMPWERASGALELTKLMRLRDPVLQCLDRDPANRPTAAQLAATLDAMFREASTVDNGCEKPCASDAPRAPVTDGGVEYAISIV